jgi:hypothetical protein
MAKKKLKEVKKSKLIKKDPATRKTPDEGRVTDPKIRCSYAALVPMSELKPYPNNPNVHQAEQIALFARILKNQGTRRPFRVSKLTGFLTAGHGQLEAYKLNGWNLCPVDYQDYDDEPQEYADVVADNSLATWAHLDLEAVQKQVESFGSKFEVEMLGVDGFSLQPEEIKFPDERGKSELTKDEKTSEYMASQSRNVVLVYSLPEFTRVTSLLGEIMKLKSFESFSDAVKSILEEYAGNLLKKSKLR